MHSLRSGRCRRIWVALVGALMAAAVVQAEAQDVPGAAREIPLAGLKVAPTTWRGATLPRVVAVRQGGPAFKAGLQPGDVITEADNRSLARSPPGFIDKIFAGMVRPGMTFQFSWEYPLSGGTPAQPGRGAASVALEAPTDSPWITTPLAHAANETWAGSRTQLPGIADAQLAAKKRFDDLYAQDVKAILANPCAKVDERSLGEPLVALALAASLPLTDYGFELAGLGHRACENQRNGSLPDFEATVIAMHWKHIDPCRYSPSTDYTAELDKARLRIGKGEYPTAATAAAFEGNPCFQAFVIARLTGRPFKPSPP